MSWYLPRLIEVAISSLFSLLQVDLKDDIGEGNDIEPFSKDLYPSVSSILYLYSKCILMCIAFSMSIAYLLA